MIEKHHLLGKKLLLAAGAQADGPCTPLTRWQIELMHGINSAKLADELRQWAAA